MRAASAIADTEWKEGWRVAASGALGYGTGNVMFLLTAGLFVTPMRDALHWSTKEVAIAQIVTLVWALTSPVSGPLVARYGARRIAITGSVLLTMCMLMLAVAPASHLAIYALAVLLGLISPLTNMVPFAAGVSSWFKRRPGLAFGVVFNGSSIVALIAVPCVTYAIATLGWRFGYATLAALSLILGLPALIAWFGEREAPGPTGPRVSEGGKKGSFLSDGRFWIYMASFGVASIALGGFMGHLQPLLATRHFPIREAATLGIIYPLSAGLGRVMAGYLLDRFRPHLVAVTLLGLAACGGILLSAVSTETSPVLIYLTVALLGLGQGAEADFIAFFSFRSFDGDAYPKVLSLLVMASGLGMALGTLTFAAIYDAYASYASACLLGAGFFLGAGALLALGAVRPIRRA